MIFMLGESAARYFKIGPNSHQAFLLCSVAPSGANHRAESPSAGNAAGVFPFQAA